MVMPACALSDVCSTVVVNPLQDDRDQRKRIVAVLGAASYPVREETLFRYYRYLSTTLTFPLTAYYPLPTDAEEEEEFRCTVLELLDPSKYLGDEIDGLFCKVRKGAYELNLPLIELFVPGEGADARRIDDYTYWFWNWR